MSIYRRVLRYYRPFLWQTIFGLCLAFFGIGLNLLKPWPFKIIVDDFLRAGSAIRADWRKWVLLLCLALIGLQLLWGIINWITNYLFVKIGLQALLRLRTDLYSHLQRLSLKFHDARRSSDSSFRVAYDSQSIQTIYNKGFTNIFGSVITLIGTFVIMLQLDWQLTLVSLGIVPLVVGSIYLFAHRIRSESTSIQEHESAVLAQAQEGLSSIRMVHAFGREEFEVRQFQQQAWQSLQANLRLTLTNVNSALVISTLMVVGTAVMYYIGTLHVLAGTLSLGSLLVFSAYLLMLYQPLESLTYTAWAMEGATAGAKRCFEVLDRQDDVVDSPDAVAISKSLDWRVELEPGRVHCLVSCHGFTIRHRVRSHLMAATFARSQRKVCEHRSRLCCRTRCCSRQRFAKTSAMAGRTRPKTKLLRRRVGRRPTSLFGKCLRDTTALSAKGADILASVNGSASGSREHF
ncbi:MAG: hypothetical protein DMF00_03160 [Verrucomicrobia bacterium]|nr:MAG: hypothetical protein DMF00_03160 [Verrucomicrobiota bacterium]